MIAVSVVTLVDNLQQIVDEINQASWDHANEISDYDVVALSAYLERQDTLFVACHDVTDDGRTLLGMASARVELKPYGNERWLYVDEVDVCANQRRRGAGKAIMRKLIELAQEAGCAEVWLGTEEDNHAANALYQSLDPDDVTQVIGYTYEILD
jgi:ribosomal protein S18 acetylase RimI-like enzyme